MMCIRETPPAAGAPNIILHSGQIVLLLFPMNHSPSSFYFWFYGYPKALAEAWART